MAVSAPCSAGLVRAPATGRPKRRRASKRSEVWTSRSGGASCSPSSVRTAPARPPSCGVDCPWPAPRRCCWCGTDGAVSDAADPANAHRHRRRAAGQPHEGAVGARHDGTLLMFVVYYTLVTSTVARREEHMLKRLYTSSARPATVLFAMAVPAILLMLMQVIVGGVAVTLLVGLDNPEHLWLLVPTMAAAAAVWCLLALALAIFTRSVEAAQLTALPLIRVAFGVSGLSVPLAVLPEVGQTLAQLSPMFPVMDLAVLVGWVALGLMVIRRAFRWEPRQ